MSNTFGPVIGPTRRRLSCRALQLALGLLHDRAGWLARRCRRALGHAQGSTERPSHARLDRLSLALGRDRGDAARAVARAAPRLVRTPARSSSRPIVAVLALYIFVVHSLTAAKPFLSPRLVLDRNYAIGLLLISIFGMLNFTPMVLLPPLLQGPVGMPELARRARRELARHRGLGRLLRRHVHQSSGPARRHGPGLWRADRFGPLADEHQPRRGLDHLERQRVPARAWPSA